MKSWSFYLSFIIPISVVVGYTLGGIFSFLTPFILFVLIPITDLLESTNNVDFTMGLNGIPQDNINFKIIPILYAIIQVTLVLWAAYIVGTQELTSPEMVGLTISVGSTTGAVGFTVAHELIHKSNIVQRTLGQAVLLVANYLHFYLEHRIGHHTNVCTPKDPSSARCGEFNN